jgi:membrane protein
MRPGRFNAKHRISTFWKAIKLTAQECVADNIFKLAAALAYYAVFSLVPMLIIIFWISGIFYESTVVKGQFFGFLQQFVGENTVKQIDDILKNTQLEEVSAWTRVFGIATLISVPPECSGRFKIPSITFGDYE